MTQISSQMIEWLADARRVSVLTGAGASAESGIPTFRDPDGFWSQADAMELASYSGFTRNPVRVQSWYSARMKAAGSVSPNPCHTALAELEDLVESVTIITQNIDGLHQRAGSTRVIELHGSLRRVYCVSCGREASGLDVSPEANEPAVCACGGLLRPDVVWFGEALPEDAYAEAVEASSQAEVFLVVGTSAEVYPAAQLPYIAAENDAALIEINLNRTPLSEMADAVAVGPAGVLTPQLVAGLRAKSKPDVK